jgi:hypothetical protein
MSLLFNRGVLGGDQNCNDLKWNRLTGKDKNLPHTAWQLLLNGCDILFDRLITFLQSFHSRTDDLIFGL